MGPVETYRYLLDELSDPRVADWPMMASPLPIILIVLVYLAFVLHVGPLLMKNRKPYALTNVMRCYNVLVACASAAVFYGLLTSGYTTSLSFGCEPVDFSHKPEPLNMARWVWWLMVLKIFELGDTIIFVLRKKYNQTTFLHVYHHAMTAFLSWVACKYAPGGMWTFSMMTNSVVHVVMYTYYLLTSLGPRIQRKIAPWKPYVTRLQLVQFVIMIVHLSQALMPSCEPSRRPLVYIYMTHIIAIFYMFLDFYKKAYAENKSV